MAKRKKPKSQPNEVEAIFKPKRRKLSAYATRSPAAHNTSVPLTVASAKATGSKNPGKGQNSTTTNERETEPKTITLSDTWTKLPGELVYHIIALRVEMNLDINEPRPSRVRKYDSPGPGFVGPSEFINLALIDQRSKAQLVKLLNEKHGRVHMRLLAYNAKHGGRNQRGQELFDFMDTMVHHCNARKFMKELEKLCETVGHRPEHDHPGKTELDGLKVGGGL